MRWGELAKPLSETADVSLGHPSSEIATDNSASLSEIETLVMSNTAATLITHIKEAGQGETFYG